MKIYSKIFILVLLSLNDIFGQKDSLSLVENVGLIDLVASIEKDSTTFVKKKGNDLPPYFFALSGTSRISYAYKREDFSIGCVKEPGTKMAYIPSFYESPEWLIGVIRSGGIVSSIKIFTIHKYSMSFQLLFGLYMFNTKYKLSDYYNAFSKLLSIQEFCFEPTFFDMPQNKNLKYQTLNNDEQEIKMVLKKNKTFILITKNREQGKVRYKGVWTVKGDSIALKEKEGFTLLKAFKNIYLRGEGLFFADFNKESESCFLYPMFN